MAGFIIFLLSFSILASSSLIARIPLAFGDSSSDQQYENSKYGVKLHYPLGWEKRESGDNYFVRFYSPYEDKFDNYQENAGLFTQIVDSAVSLNDFVNSYMMKVQGAYTDFMLQNSTDSILAGNPSKTVYTSQLDFDKDGKFDHETMRIFTIKDGKAYVFIYTAVTGRYATYLSNVQSMLATLEIDTSKLPKTVPSENQKFENSTMGIKASYPSTWDLVPSPDEKITNYFYSPLETDADPFEEFVYTSVDKLQEQETLQQYVDTFIGYFKNDTDYQLIETSQTALGGISGQKVVLISSGYYGGEDIEIMGSFALKGNYIYSVVLSAEKSRFSDYEPIAQAIVDSIQITSTPSLGQSAISLLTYSNSIYGISIQYPDEWEKSDGDQIDPTQIVVFTGTPAGYFERGAHVSISFEGVPPGFSLQNYMDATLEGLKDSETYNIADLQSSHTTLGGDQAARIQFTITSNETTNQAKILQVATLKDNRLYFLTYVSSSDSFDKDLPTVEEMIKSFEFIPSTINLSETKEYLSYANATSGINASYPDNWRKSERIGNGVIFYSPKLDASLTITYTDLSSPGTTLSDIAEETNKDLAKRITLYNKVESNTTTIGNGFPAMKLVYTGIGDLFEKNQPMSIKAMRVWTIKDTRIFFIEYSTFGELYSVYLPAVEKIINSLQFDSKSFPKFITSHYDNFENDFQIKIPDHWRGLESKQGNITRAYFTLDNSSNPDVGLNTGGTSGIGSSGSSKDSATIVVAFGSQKDFRQEQAKNKGKDDLKCDHTSAVDAIDLKGEAKALVFVEDCHNPKMSKFKSYLIQTGEKSIYISLGASSTSAFQNSLPALDAAVGELHLSGAVDITDVKVYAGSNDLKFSKHSGKNGDKAFDIDIASNSEVGILRLDNQTRTLSFDVGGKEGTNGETYFEIGTLLTGPYTIMLDGEPMDEKGILLINDKASSKTFLSLTYGHSTHTISVQGASIVPEYPMPVYFVILAFSIAVVTLISMGRRKNLGRLWKS